MLIPHCKRTSCFLHPWEGKIRKPALHGIKRRQLHHCLGKAEVPIHFQEDENKLVAKQVALDTEKYSWVEKIKPTCLVS